MHLWLHIFYEIEYEKGFPSFGNENLSLMMMITGKVLSGDDLLWYEDPTCLITMKMVFSVSFEYQMKQSLKLFSHHRFQRVEWNNKTNRHEDRYACWM